MLGSFLGMYAPVLASKTGAQTLAAEAKEKASTLAASALAFMRGGYGADEVPAPTKHNYQEQALTVPTGPERLNLGTISDGPFIPPEDGRAIYVDLRELTLTLYALGKPVEVLPVLSIGRRGTPWETPSGTYRVQTKEENHYSSIGNVWMPYSMEFFGNFFIHGWPYYDSGKAVPEGYSGGCIRLSTDDAKKVFEFADYGTPVVIKRSVSGAPKNLAGAASYFTRYSDSAKPNVTAAAYLIADLETGDILSANNVNKEYPIASVSKLFTALVSLEAVNQYTPLRVSQAALATYGTTGKLGQGEKITAGDLLYPLLLESSNDAAEVIAEHIGRNHFINLMNEKAKAIGLTHTTFKDPSGLSPENISTVRDLFKTAQHINETKRYIFEVTRMQEFTNSGKSPTTWVNNNPFVSHRYPEYRGGKQGFTDEAQKTVVALFDVPVSEFEVRTLAVVLLRSSNLEEDAGSLLSYVKKNLYYGATVAVNQ